MRIEGPEHTRNGAFVDCQVGAHVIGEVSLYQGEGLGERSELRPQTEVRAVGVSRRDMSAIEPAQNCENQNN